MNLMGTPLASEASTKQYGHVVRHRIVPRQFSVVEGEKIFDTEEVVVGTDAMPFEDYLYLRGVCFTINTFFSSTELIPLKRLLLESGIEIADWVFNVTDNIEKFPDVKEKFDQFMQETREELFDTQEELVKFYNDPQHYQELLDGKRGDNLLRKYKCLVLAENYASALDLAIQEARPLLQKKLGAKKADSLLKDVSSFLRFRDMHDLLEEKSIVMEQDVTLQYNIPAWLKTKKKLDQTESSFKYSVKYRKDIKKHFEEFMKMNKDRSLSLQILYRDGTIRELWPSWTLSS